ncbi:hypothetical protein ASG89_11830 [Paenibacillus sp. Soil766]|uniref:hypothetical protein n=1 Tax=Paenibacillus sp. Soil766 TaxID=1736404 RepID=UPI00070EA02B|nr:hypothetical protein [Paenibacillus sp. Soil766]KRE83802.1 hypothetical protein ASG89_11830 [Paenibacillus sp. Soil766]
MRILLFGTSQIHNVRRLLEHNGNEVVFFTEEYFNMPKYMKPFLFLKMLKNIDLVYRVYSHPKYDWRLLLSKLAGKKTLTHWIGTDVLDAMREYRKLDITTKLSRTLIDLNLAGSPLLKEELKEIGVEAVEIPILPSMKFPNMASMPRKHAVLVYAPEGKEFFYGMDYVKNLAKEYTNIIFHIVANSQDNLLLPNVIFHGKLSLDEMGKLYDEITILFRFPEHDGLSIMLLEALSRGKYVIYPYRFPNVFTPKSRNFEDVLSCFVSIITTTPTINNDGARFVRDVYNESNILKMYNKVFIEIMKAGF